MDKDSFEIIKYGHQYPKKVKQLVSDWLKENYKRKITDWCEEDENHFVRYTKYSSIEIYYGEVSDSVIIKVHSQYDIVFINTKHLSDEELLSKFADAMLSIDDFARMAAIESMR